MPPADDVLIWLADVFLALAAIGCLYLATSVLVVLRHGSRTSKEAVRPEPVTILVPLCGPEPGLDARLRALGRQDYAAPVQIVCGVLGPDDPAVKVVEKVVAEPLSHDIDLHVDTEVHGRNLKVSNLINMADRARHDTLVMVDSDIEVEPDYLSNVVAELQKAGVGGVTCLYGGVTAGGVWAHLASMEINLHFLPNVVFALTFGLARPCFGSTIAMSRETLRQIGGFQAFAEQLWDDYAIGEAIRRLGRRVAVPSFAVGHVCSEETAGALLARQLRFARTIKSIDPLGYAGGIVTHPFPLAVIALICGGGPQALGLALLALACRMGLGRAVEKRFGVEPASYLLVPIRECISFAVFAASFFGTSVLWRGRRYRIASDGTLVPYTD
jgi:ceramide glucosyltransferase